MANPGSKSVSASGDLIADSMTRMATTASKQKKLVFVTLVIVLAATLAFSLYLTKRNAFRSQASDALFRARQTLDTEMKAVGESLKPPASVKVKTDKASPAQPVAPNVDFAKFDVSTKLKDSVAALGKVAEEYPGTLAGFDAKMELGSLYYNHATGPADYEAAHAWFDKAASTAPSSDQTIAALYNLGYAQESLGKCAESVKSFDRAINSGSGPFMGELLRGKARCQETLGDKPGAKATYESMIQKLPGTEYAKIAESKKAGL